MDKPIKSARASKPTLDKQQDHTQAVAISADEAAVPEQERVAFIRQAVLDKGVVASSVVGEILKPLAAEHSADLAKAMMASMLDDLKPTSALERVLIEQMILNHAQSMRLQRLAYKAERYEHIEQMVNLAAKMQGELRKTMKALKDWRTPVQPVIHAKQANVAHQQIINNPPEPTNEVGGNDA